MIAVLAVVGLAYTFGLGRALIDRFEQERVADALARSRIEYLVSLSQTQPNSDSLQVGIYPAVPNPFVVNGVPLGTESWHVDPAPASVPSSIRPHMVQVTAVVAWESSGVPDSVTYSRLLSTP